MSKPIEGLTFLGRQVVYVDASDNGEVPECWASGSIDDSLHLHIGWARDRDHHADAQRLTRSLHWRVRCGGQRIADGLHPVGNDQTATNAVCTIVPHAERRTRAYAEKLWQSLKWERGL